MTDQKAYVEILIPHHINLKYDRKVAEVSKAYLLRDILRSVDGVWDIGKINYYNATEDFVNEIQKTIETEKVVARAFDAGYNGRLLEDPPADIPEEYSDVWSDNWNAGMMDARHDRYDALTDARELDATGQDQWKQDRV